MSDSRPNRQKYKTTELPDKRFGMLTVVQECEPLYRRYRDKKNKLFRKKFRRLLCLCDCGNLCIVDLDDVSYGRKTHCGCQTTIKPKKTVRKPPTKRERAIEQAKKNRIKRLEDKTTYPCEKCGKPRDLYKHLCNSCYVMKWNKEHNYKPKKKYESRYEKLTAEEKRARRMLTIEQKASKYTPNTEKGRQFVELYKTGLTIKEIGEQVGLSMQRVERLMAGKGDRIKKIKNI